MLIAAKVLFENGDSLLLEEDGTVVGNHKRFRGAVVVNSKGKTVDAYFMREVTTKPETIKWQFRDRTQRVFLYEGDGIRLEGKYTVVKFDHTPSLFD